MRVRVRGSASDSGATDSAKNTALRERQLCPRKSGELAAHSCNWFLQEVLRGPPGSTQLKTSAVRWTDGAAVPGQQTCPAVAPPGAGTRSADGMADRAHDSGTPAVAQS